MNLELENALIAIVKSFEQDSPDQVNEFLERVGQQDDLTDLDTFSYFVLGRLEKLLDAIIKKNIPKSNENAKLVFSYRNLRFIEKHFETIIVRNESRMCVGDKSSKILNKLIQYVSAQAQLLKNSA